MLRFTYYRDFVPGYYSAIEQLQSAFKNVKNKSHLIGDSDLYLQSSVKILGEVCEVYSHNRGESVFFEFLGKTLRYKKDVKFSLPFTLILHKLSGNEDSYSLVASFLNLLEEKIENLVLKIATKGNRMYLEVSLNYKNIFNPEVLKTRYIFSKDFQFISPIDQRGLLFNLEDGLDYIIEDCKNYLEKNLESLFKSKYENLFIRNKEDIKNIIVFLKDFGLNYYRIIKVGEYYKLKQDNNPIRRFICNL